MGNIRFTFNFLMDGMRTNLYERHLLTYLYYRFYHKSPKATSPLEMSNTTHDYGIELNDDVLSFSGQTNLSHIKNLTQI